MRNCYFDANSCFLTLTFTRTPKPVHIIPEPRIGRLKDTTVVTAVTEVSLLPCQFPVAVSEAIVEVQLCGEVGRVVPRQAACCKDICLGIECGVFAGSAKCNSTTKHGGQNKSLPLLGFVPASIYSGA